MLNFYMYIYENKCKNNSNNNSQLSMMRDQYNGKRKMNNTCWPPE